MELGHDKAAKWGHLQASKMGSWSLANRYGLKKGSGGFSKGGGQSLFKECLSSSLASPFSHSFVHQQNCAKYLAGVEQRTRGSPGRHHGEEVKRERVSLRKEQGLTTESKKQGALALETSDWELPSGQRRRLCGEGRAGEQATGEETAGRLKGKGGGGGTKEALSSAAGN